ncbi:DUF5708 family protein [Amycolatopsis taiwanensis]|uniref:Uncharacterized protein n=1 Tax=Amycolatopsis taiwanensis TaxID=342230 RepID=A0A9W6QWZ1_9PSEU|nr:DUF5708 family protein [Amycolatopsis taiwanensis]GLY65569.1 hypothetical protein Atai01_21880 [Amycolatopsis taiwanensis]
MRKHAWSVVAGAVMVAVGLVLYFVFHDVETPVVGLRQVGAVVAVLGVIEVAVSVARLLRPSVGER